MISSLVIWAHSECRSTAALFEAVRQRAEERGIRVAIRLWNGVKLPDSRCRRLAGAVEVGDDLAKGLDTLREFGGPGSVQVFCVYQNSRVWRELIRAAKRSGARVVVYAEAPCEMCLGFKAALKRAYYRCVLPARLRSTIRAADLLISQSGRNGLDRLLRLGWRKDQIVPFGYAAARLEADAGEEPSRAAGDFYLHLGSEARYRGVEVAERAARQAGVRLVRSGGALGAGELVRAIRNAKAVVACGYCEPWGMRVNEALLEGTPVIVSEGMGARMLVEDYGCGCVVPRGDAVALAAVLRRCERESDFLARIRSGAARAAQDLRPERQAVRFLALVMGEAR